MQIEENKIKLTQNENELFSKQLKLAIISQLFNEKMLTNEQLGQILTSLDK
jgi:hypothetical protein